MKKNIESPKTEPSVETLYKDLITAVGELPINESECERNTKTLSAAKLLMLGVCAAIDEHATVECGEPIVRDLEQALGFMAAAHYHFEEDLLSQGMMTARSRARFRDLSAAIESLEMAQLRAESAKNAIAGSDEDECPF